MTAPTQPRIAIVSMGGLFPSLAAPADPDQLWAQVLQRRDASRPPPPGRWLLEPDDVFDTTIAAPDRVYSRHGCFLDPFRVQTEGLDLPPGLLDDLDPLFHLTLEAGRQAFQAANTTNLDRRRAGVILGNIVLPTEKASALAQGAGRPICGADTGGRAAAFHNRAAQPPCRRSPSNLAGPGPGPGWHVLYA